jgi:hypothetical protein
LPHFHLPRGTPSDTSSAKQEQSKTEFLKEYLQEQFIGQTVQDPDREKIEK